MRSDSVALDPDTLQFNREYTQTLKVVNQTNAPLSDFFFCLYNTEKFEFSPATFSLEPYEHKLITVTLKNKTIRSAVREFAYLKSTELNKRVTIFINNFTSPDPKHAQDGEEDLNTLSSREYRDLQNAAMEHIARERESLHQRDSFHLSREKEGHSLLYKQAQHSSSYKQGQHASYNQRQLSANKLFNAKTENSNEKRTSYSKEVSDLQMKVALVQNENSNLLRDNVLLQDKFQHYRRSCERDLREYQRTTLLLKQKEVEVQKLNECVCFLEEKGGSFLKLLTEKDEKIKEIQNSYKKTTEADKCAHEQQLKALSRKLQEREESWQGKIQFLKEHTQQLEQKVQAHEEEKKRNEQLRSQLMEKEERIGQLALKMEETKEGLSCQQQFEKKYIRLELMHESLNEKHVEVSKKLAEAEKTVGNLREQVYVYRTKIGELQASADKVDQYVNIALESTQNENATLKRSKQELQQQVQSMLLVNRQSQDGFNLVNDKLHRAKQEVQLLTELKDTLQRKCEELKQDHHLALMQLRNQNIQLLQKVALHSAFHSNKHEEAEFFNRQINARDALLAQTHQTIDQMQTKLVNLTSDNISLQQRVRRHKREAKKQMKGLGQETIEELRRTNEERRKLENRVHQLETTLDGYSQKDKRNDNAGGIKHQRKQIERDVDFYELKELENYLKGQYDRIIRVFKLAPFQELEPIRPLYKAMTFIKLIQDRLRDRDDNSHFENLKNRVKELQSGKEAKEISSLSLNRTYGTELLEYIKKQMKNQYKKLNQTIKLNQQKYQLLKKKIYEEYRCKIIEVINKKEKGGMNIQSILERFIEGMSNLSHKEALIHKQMKLKQAARKDLSQIKQKYNEVLQLLQTQKGICSRNAVRPIFNETEIQWEENLKRQAELLSTTAEYQRLKQQMSLKIEKQIDLKQKNTHYVEQLNMRNDQVQKLRRSYAELEQSFADQMIKQKQIIQEQKRKITDMTKNTKQNKVPHRDNKQIILLKEDVQKKKQTIRNLKQKQKKIEELLLQNNRVLEQQRKKQNDENRLLESIRDIKESNRELRLQNAQLSQKLRRVSQDLDKKTLYLKNLKETTEQSKNREWKKDEVEKSQLKSQIEQLIEDLKRSREQFERLKRQKERDLQSKDAEIQSLQSQSIISVKSFQSIIRALIETFRKIYSSLRILIKRRKGKDIGDSTKIAEITSNVAQINALRLHEQFQQAIKILQSQ